MAEQAGTPDGVAGGSRSRPGRHDEPPVRDAVDHIAIISDIHGNLPALEATLRDIRRRGIGHIVCLGDLVGKGPYSDVVVDVCAETCETVVRGNWDDALATA